MADGWYCEQCKAFWLDVHVQTKITVEIEPRDYAAPQTFCSLECLDECRASLDADIEEGRSWHPVKPVTVQRYVEDWGDFADLPRGGVRG